MNDVPSENAIRLILASASPRRRELLAGLERPFDVISPQIDETAYVSKHAVLAGDVRIGKNASVWPGCVLRADINTIELGENSNLQDGTIVHLSNDAGVKVGKNTTVGHGAIIHACTIGERKQNGMGAIILDNAVIGDNSIVGAGEKLAGVYLSPFIGGGIEYWLP